MELQTACEIIKVQPDCTLTELDKQYDQLIRKETRSTHLDNLHQAYQVIYTHILQDDDTEKSFRKKVDNFFYHYKSLAIFGLLIAILGGSFLYTVIDSQIEKRKEANRPPANLEIMIFGDYEDDGIDKLESRIKDLLPDWESVEIQFVYAPSDADSQANMAYMQKNQAIIATETPDMYILDLKNYEKFIENGPFLALDQLESQITTESVSEVDLKFFQQEDDNREHLYGIDLIGNEIFKDLAIQKEATIAVIRTKTPNKDNAFLFLEKILE